MTAKTGKPDAGPPRVAIAWPESNRRSLWIWGAGAVIGLVAAGAALFTAKGSSVGGVPPEDAAVVNQRPILASDVALQMQTQLGIPIGRSTLQQRRQVVDDLIREELMVQRGLELDEPSVDPDTRAALVSAVQSQVSVDATSQTPTPAELRAFYERHKDRYSSIGVMTVRDLMVAAPGSAADQANRLEQARQALGRGEAVDAVIRRFQLKESGRLQGEELYFAVRLHIGDALFKIASQLDDGQTSAPVAAADGVHLLVMAKNQKPRPRAFEAALNQVYSDYKDALQQTLQDGEYRYLREKADIRIARNYGG